MKRTIHTGIFFEYWDLIIGHYICLLLIWGVFITDIEQGFKIDLYTHVENWWRVTTYFIVFVISVFMIFHLSGRPLSFFENGIAWFRNEDLAKRRATALAYLAIALIFNPMTYLMYEPHWVVLLPDVFLMFIFTKEIVHSNRLRKELKRFEAEERKISSRLSEWISGYDFQAIDNYYKIELQKGLSFEELLRLIIDLKSPAYLKKNFSEIKDAFYPIGWQRDLEPSGFDLYCDEVFQRIVDIENT